MAQSTISNTETLTDTVNSFNITKPLNTNIYEVVEFKEEYDYTIENLTEKKYFFNQYLVPDNEDKLIEKKSDDDFYDEYDYPAQ